MSSDEEYYIIFHVDGCFVKDSYVRYVGGEVIRFKEDPDTRFYFELVKIGLGFNTVMLIYFHEPSTVRLQNNLSVIYDDTSTVAMLDFWVKFKQIDLYVEHEVDNLIIVDENFLLTTGEGDVQGVEVDGEGDDEGVESGGEGDVGEVQADGEGVSATGIEVDKDIGMESGGHIILGSIVGEDNDSEVAADEYAGDFATLDRVDNVADEYVGDFATSDGVDNDSDEHGSLVGSDEDEEHEDGKRRSKFPLYNDKLKFSLGMLFKDGKQFKSEIRKYCKECRRQLKFIKNEPKMVVDEHHCSISFKNKMVTTIMIAQDFEPIIKYHPKMKLKEIQGRCAFEMHVNDYAHELRSKIPGRIIKMVVQRVKADSLPHFKRYYLCFDALKRGRKAWCKPLIGLDGCFLKGSFKSEFLIVVGRDRNNQIFPIALSVVEMECTDSWGLDIGISDILPRVKHRNCVRHMFANWSGGS
ncbi:hypothetical protein ES332_D02G155800v1 [Gossypium tomentosum]|uniref:Transposase MuDR plant domain-containing protein n=1 Tax=Gossypium tomentosum TaxID=34277 RepID=A0A5D2LXL1_GOSTO|nr:hypothetical protein ES332_D02G155800v1 [Gossypium tomentosum]